MTNSTPSRVTKNANYLHDLPMSAAIRNGKCGTCPTLLTNYLDKCSNFAKQLPLTQKREVYKNILDILMETICDDLIAKCWRGWCLDNLYKPLGELRCLSETEEDSWELAMLEEQMRTLSNYFLN